MSHKRTSKTRLAPDGLPDEGFARIRQVLWVLAISKTAFYRGIAEGRYPKPVKLGPRTKAWDVEKIREVIAATKADDDAA